MIRPRFWLTAVALTVGLVLPPVLPEVANVGYLLLAGLGLFTALASRSGAPITGSPTVLMPIGAAILLAVALVANFRSPSDLLVLAMLAPLLLVGGFAWLVRRNEGADPGVIGLGAAVGSVAAATVACLDVYGGATRAGSMVANPIHFAAIALSLGFISLTGLYARRLAVQGFCILGLLSGLLAVWLSGSRGPLVAAPAMLLTALITLLFHRFGRRMAVLSALGIVALAIVAGAWVLQSQSLGSIRAIDALSTYIRGGVAIDASVAARLDMYHAGLLAFSASPWFGHGADFMAVAATYAAAPAALHGYDHLHSDVVDFLAIGGILGLAAYLLLLLAGPITALRSYREAPGALILTLPVAVGYAIMGLTNATFGILSQTTLMAVVLALVAALAPHGRNSEKG